VYAKIYIYSIFKIYLGIYVSGYYFYVTITIAMLIHISTFLGWFSSGGGKKLSSPHETEPLTGEYYVIVFIVYK
jgi:hypothetical protein